MHKYFAVVPARKNSKGIKHKNLQIIGQKPMLQYTFEAVLASMSLDYTVLSSDDPAAISLAGQMNIPAPFTRPDNLSLDNSKSVDVFLHALDWYQSEFTTSPKYIVVLQPTSPFRNGNDIDEAIRQFEKSATDSLISVCEVTQHPSDCITITAKKSIKRVLSKVDGRKEGRQGFQKAYFIDGGIYISSVERFLHKKTMFDDQSEVYIISMSHAIDVDTPFDLEVARAFHEYAAKQNSEFFNL